MLVVGGGGLPCSAQEPSGPPDSSQPGETTFRDRNLGSLLLRPRRGRSALGPSSVQGMPGARKQSRVGRRGQGGGGSHRADITLLTAVSLLSRPELVVSYLPPGMASKINTKGERPACCLPPTHASASSSATLDLWGLSFLLSPWSAVPLFFFLCLRRNSGRSSVLLAVLLRCCWAALLVARC